MVYDCSPFVLWTNKNTALKCSWATPRTAFKSMTLAQLSQGIWLYYENLF